MEKRRGIEGVHFLLTINEIPLPGKLLGLLDQKMRGCLLLTFYKRKRGLYAYTYSFFNLLLCIGVVGTPLLEQHLIFLVIRCGRLSFPKDGWCGFFIRIGIKDFFLIILLSFLSFLFSNSKVIKRG